jgi:hypothetical protein
MRTSIRTKLLTTALAGTALVGVATGPAMAETTTTTFELTGGALAVSVPANADIDAVATGILSMGDTLGDVTVTDARGALLADGWSVEVSSTDFITGSTVPGSDGLADRTIPKSAISYNPGTPALSSTGVAVRLPGLPGNLASPRVAMATEAIVGNNVTTWTPTITVDIPADAVAGVYTGVITHSIA